MTQSVCARVLGCVCAAAYAMAAAAACTNEYEVTLASDKEDFEVPADPVRYARVKFAFEKGQGWSFTTDQVVIKIKASSETKQTALTFTANNDDPLKCPSAFTWKFTELIEPPFVSAAFTMQVRDAVDKPAGCEVKYTVKLEASGGTIETPSAVNGDYNWDYQGSYIYKNKDAGNKLFSLKKEGAADATKFTWVFVPDEVKVTVTGVTEAKSIAAASTYRSTAPTECPDAASWAEIATAKITIVVSKPTDGTNWWGWFFGLCVVIVVGLVLFFACGCGNADEQAGADPNGGQAGIELAARVAVSG